MYFVLFLFFVVALGIFLNLLHLPSPRTWWYSKNIHGPKGWPLLGNALELAKLEYHEMLDYIFDTCMKFPRFTSFRVIGTPRIFLFDPEDIEVLLSSVAHIQKGSDYNTLTTWLNEGLLISTGKKWHKKRKMLTPSFHFRILDDNLPRINKHANLLVEKMLQAANVDIESYAKLFALDVVCETAMGVELGAQKNQGREYVNAIKRIGEIVMNRAFTFWKRRDWIFYLTPDGNELKKLAKYLHGITEKVIVERRKTYMPNGSDAEEEELNIKKRLAFLDSLIDYETKHPNSLSEKEIREEVDTFMFAGHDTTSSALTYIAFVLANYEDIQNKVVEELYEIFGESDRRIEMKDVARMAYLEKVIKETFRLFPPVPFISRELEFDLILKGNVMVPAGSIVSVIPFGLHRKPDLYPEPEKFDPERFSEGEIQKRHPFAYLPFSAGPRNCIGQKFAMLEIKVTIATVLRKAHLKTVTKMEEVKHLPLMILRPDIPIIVKVLPRNS